jgi:hypothetical protein
MAAKAFRGSLLLGRLYTPELLMLKCGGWSQKPPHGLAGIGFKRISLSRLNMLSRYVCGYRDTMCFRLAMASCTSINSRKVVDLCACGAWSQGQKGGTR